MGCCVALAYLVAWVRRAWLSVVPGPAVAVTPFAPPARRPAAGPVVALPRPTAHPAPPRHPLATALVVVGLVWFAVGIVGMHALGWFAWADGSLVSDTAFHASGLWIAAAGVATAAVRS